MVNDQKSSCTSEFGVEVLMVITSSIIACSVLYLVQIEMPMGNTFLSDRSANLFLSSAHALFLPLMSYLFSQAKQYNPEGKAQVILIWMLLAEIIRIRGDSMSNWGLRKLFEQLARLLWVGFLVYNFTPLHGIRITLFILCVYFAICVILKGIILNKADQSYLIGKNPKLIHHYIKRVMFEDHLHTTPMSNCDYIIMGEENHEITVCDNGYLLGENKPESPGVLKIGRVFQLQTLEDRILKCRDRCLSFALAKMLRRRFAKLILDEAGCEKALDFVLEGLVDYIGGGGNQDIQTDKSIEERNPNPTPTPTPTERLFDIIHEELNFVSELLHKRAPINHYFTWYIFLDLVGVSLVGYIGIYFISQISRKGYGWLSAAARDGYSGCFFNRSGHGSMVLKVFFGLDLTITILLFIACVYIQCTGSILAIMAIGNQHWHDLSTIERYIKDPVEWEKSHSSTKTSARSKKHSRFVSVMTKFGKAKRLDVKKACAQPSVKLDWSILDIKAENIIFGIKLDWSILVSLLKWIKRNIPRATPTVVHSTNAKARILRSLKGCKGRLTCGETSLISNKMADLNCRLEGSITEVILVWHIATTLFDHQHQEPPVLKEQEVALELSNYCHYLVAYFPELLPDEVEWTEDMYEKVIKDILAIELSSDQKPTKMNRSNALLARWGGSSPGDERTSSMLEKGTELAKDLMKRAEDRKLVWKMLAGFWAEMMLFIAPSDNVEAHEEVLYRGELITQLWALLTHAGILTRPIPTEHHHNVCANDEIYYVHANDEITEDMNV